jgi:hypothetical protein
MHHPFRYELNVQENWKNLKIQEIESMISKPIFSNDAAASSSSSSSSSSMGMGDLRSNFDPTFFTFLKENERLAKMDVMVPSVNQFLIKKKDYFFMYSDTVDMILYRYNMSLRR